MSLTIFNVDYMKRTFFVVFLASILVFLLTSWTAAYSVYAAGWSESVAYFLITYLLMDKYVRSDSIGISVISAIVLGRIIIMLPIRIINFREMLPTMFVPFVSIVGIVLGVLCFREKRIIVALLSLIILILMNTVAHYAWYEMIIDMRR